MIVEAYVLLLYNRASTVSSALISEHISRAPFNLAMAIFINPARKRESDELFLGQAQGSYLRQLQRGIARPAMSL